MWRGGEHPRLAEGAGARWSRRGVRGGQTREGLRPAGSRSEREVQLRPQRRRQQRGEGEVRGNPALTRSGLFHTGLD